MTINSIRSPISLPSSQYCQVPERKPSPSSSSEEGKKYDLILKHFTKNDYVLPINEGNQEERGLDEREMMYLVSYTIRAL